MSTKVLVTGASGFLGSRIVRQLVEAGEHVKAMVRATSNLGALAGLPPAQVEIVQGDIRIAHTVYRSLAGCDRMFHVAADNRIWAERPKDVLEAATVGTRETLEAARKRGLRRVVYTSSAAVLGTTPDPVEMDETHDFNLQDAEAYVEGKQHAIEIAREYDGRLDVVVTMPSALLGPGDWKPTPIGAELLRYLGWDVPFFDFPLMGGGLSFADVDDVARGHLLAMLKGAAGEAYLLGGDNLTYEQLFSMVAELTGLPGPGSPSSKGTVELFARLGEMRARFGGASPTMTHRMARDLAGAYVYVSSAKAEKALGYAHRSARKALSRSIQWFLENGQVRAAQARRIRFDLRAPA